MEEGGKASEFNAKTQGMQGRKGFNTISENLYRVSGFDEISNACNPGYGGAVDDAFFESGNMS